MCTLLRTLGIPITYAPKKLINLHSFREPSSIYFTAPAPILQKKKGRYLKKKVKFVSCVLRRNRCGAKEAEQKATTTTTARSSYGVAFEFRISKILFCIASQPARLLLSFPFSLLLWIMTYGLCNLCSNMWMYAGMYVCTYGQLQIYSFFFHPSPSPLSSSLRENDCYDSSIFNKFMAFSWTGMEITLSCPT